MHLSATFTGKRPQKSDAGIKDAFEEMEHEFPFETFRPRKQGRFPINQNVRFKFRQHPLANGTTFSKIFKKGQPREAYPTFGYFSREFLEFSVECFATQQFP